MEIKRDKELIVKGFKDCLTWVNEFDNDLLFTMDSELKILNMIDQFIELSNLNYISDDSYNTESIQWNLYENIGHDIYLTVHGHGTGFWGRPEIYLHNYHNMFSEVCEKLKPFNDTWINDNNDIEVE